MTDDLQETTPQQEEVERPAVKKDVEMRSVVWFCTSEYFPMRVAHPEFVTLKEQNQILEHLGFVIHGNEENMFKVTMPKGWVKVFDPKTVSTGWCYLYDDRKRPRGAIYFRDTGTIECYINYMSRYRPMVRHAAKYAQQHVEYQRSPMLGIVLDGDTEIFRTKLHAMHFQPGSKHFVEEERNVRRKLFAEAEKWLKEIKPNFENILDYWDE